MVSRDQQDTLSQQSSSNDQTTPPVLRLLDEILIVVFATIINQHVSRQLRMAPASLDRVRASMPTVARRRAGVPDAVGRAANVTMPERQPASLSLEVLEMRLYKEHRGTDEDCEDDRQAMEPFSKILFGGEAPLLRNPHLFVPIL